MVCAPGVGSAPGSCGARVGALTNNRVPPRLLVTQQEGGKVAVWVPLQPPASSLSSPDNVPSGEVLLELAYKVGAGGREVPGDKDGAGGMGGWLWYARWTGGGMAVLTGA